MGVLKALAVHTPVWVTPNRLSWFRIWAAALILAAYPLHPLAAFTVYLIACATDWLDGELARTRNLMTAEGKKLDEQADKWLAIGIALLMSVEIGRGQVQFHLSEVFLLAAGVILFRDFIITWLRERMPARAAKMPSLRSAKWKTGAFMAGSALVLLGTVDSSGLWPWIANMGTVAVVGSLGLALYSGYEYISYLFLR